MGSIVAEAVGGMQVANAQRTQSQFQAGVAGQNAALAGAQGAQALAAGNTQAGLAEMKGSQIAATQKADYAASGVTADAGTPSTVQLTTKAMADLDAATARNNAARQAWGYQVQKTNDVNQAALDIYGGQQNVEATVLGTGSKVASDSENFLLSYGSKASK